jgi:hypothetical protein
MIPALGRLRHEDLEFKVSLSYIFKKAQKNEKQENEG